jgi:hypothetical protein
VFFAIGQWSHIGCLDPPAVVGFSDHWHMVCILGSDAGAEVTVRFSTRRIRWGEIVLQVGFIVFGWGLIFIGSVIEEREYQQALARVLAPDTNQVAAPTA